MASLEQLQQLDAIDDDNSSTSSDSSSSDSDSSDASKQEAEEETKGLEVDKQLSPEVPTSKCRIKLSLRLPLGKLPKAQNDIAHATTNPKMSIISDEKKMETNSVDGQDEIPIENSQMNDETEKQETVRKDNVEVAGAGISPKGKQKSDDTDQDVKAKAMPSLSTSTKNDTKPSSPKNTPSTATSTPTATTSISAGKGSTGKRNASTASNKRRSSSNTSSNLSAGGRAVRLPPMPSPGLLIPPTAGIYRGGADASGFTTAASVFDHGMSLAGYTLEGRTKHPHRGSSVKRVVDDMFDSNVLFTLHFPKLVDDDLWSTNNQVKAQDAKKEEKVTAEANLQKHRCDPNETLPAILLRALSKPKSKLGEIDKTQQQKCEIDNTRDVQSRKRRRHDETIKDMVPISLTAQYPEAYIQKRLEYVRQVEDRERAIIASQQASEAAEDAREAYEEALAKYNNSNSSNLDNKKQQQENGKDGPPKPPPTPPPVQIPPLPKPPTPPRLSEMNENGHEHANLSQHDEESYPIYIPKGKESFVSHLDKNCFHITEGRYYGMLSNTIADPHFVGPNAPGIAGLNVSGGTGLATAYTGSGSSSAAGSSQGYYVGSAFGGSSSNGMVKLVSSKHKGSEVIPSKASVPKKSNANSINGCSGGDSDLNAEGCSVSASEVAPSSKTKRGISVGPTPTSTATDLKKIMEEGKPDEIEQMKVTIIRAAVYASRSGLHGGFSFAGPNGETYPDVAKAFAAHAGLRPCNRCKNNKQGAYHCRLRRKHKDLDYDGGNSWGTLSPLFSEPMDGLVLK